MIEVDGEVLHKDDLAHPASRWSKRITITGRTHIGGIWGSKTGVSHDGDYHMLLHVERSGVKTPGVSEGGKSTGRKDLFHEFTDWESAAWDCPSVTVRDELERAKLTAVGRRWHQH